MKPHGEFGNLARKKGKGNIKKIRSDKELLIGFKFYPTMPINLTAEAKKIITMHKGTKMGDHMQNEISYHSNNLNKWMQSQPP